MSVGICLNAHMPSKYILVTGGRGFVGTHVINALKQHGLGVDTFDKVDGQDISDFQQLLKTAELLHPRWIIHLAGQVFLNPSLKNPQNDVMLNVVGTLNVLETARKHDCGITFSSSGAIYGNNYQYPEPISPYGLSKLTAERYCQLYNKLYGLHTVVFRFSSVYGAGRVPCSINLIVQKAMNGETIRITGDGNQTRDFTYVADVADALVMSAEQKFPSGVYDIGTGTATSLNELIAVLERMLNKKIDVEYIPDGVGDPKRNELNVSKAACYGFKARTALEEGLKKLIEGLKK